MDVKKFLLFELSANSYLFLLLSGTTLHIFPYFHINMPMLIICMHGHISAERPHFRISLINNRLVTVSFSCNIDFQPCADASVIVHHPIVLWQNIWQQ